MTTVDEFSDKRKVADEFILRSALLDRFTAKPTVAQKGHPCKLKMLLQIRKRCCK